MKSRLFQNKLEVKKSSIHGYGVFAKKRIRAGEIIEECYAVITQNVDKVLDDFYFDAKGKDAVLTGFGWLYNHSQEPNADYTFYPKKKIFVFKAEKTIQKGEEIFVSYGDDWFSSRKRKEKKPKAFRKKKAKK